LEVALNNNEISNNMENRKQKLKPKWQIYFLMLIMIPPLIIITVSCGQKRSNTESESPIEFPKTRAGECAKEFITAFNSDDPKLYEEFLKKYRDSAYLNKESLEYRLKDKADWKKSWGTYNVIRITKGTEKQITFLTKTSPKGYAVIVRIQLKDTIDGKIEFNTFSKITPPKNAFNASDDNIIGMANRAQSTSTALIKQTVNDLASIIDSSYVYPEKGKSIADSLLQNLQDGKYDKISSAGGFSDLINEDLMHFSNDLHLFVEVTNVGMPASMLFEHRNPEEVKKLNYGFAKTEILENNIGYLKIDMLRGDDDAITVASKEFSKVTDCNAVVLDLRENVGGTCEMVNYMASLLFKDSTLLTITYDRENNIINEDYTSPGLSPIKFDSDIPIFILTSKKTSSAAEAFTYALKHLKRATIIGERTAGMAHASEETIVNEYFRLLLPIHRTINPITHSDWEGKGVIPHIETKENKALKKALKMAMDN